MRDVELSIDVCSCKKAGLSNIHLMIRNMFFFHHCLRRTQMTAIVERTRLLLLSETLLTGSVLLDE